MEKLTEIKATVTAVFAALTAWLGVLAVPVYLMVAANVVDYFTGMAAAPKRGQAVSSDVGLRGIVKKVCMWVLVGVGCGIDALITYATGAIGLDLKMQCFVGALVAVWIVCNELLSILENIADIGVPLPPFLTKIVEKIKTETEGKGGVK